MKIFIGADHRGFELKNEIKNWLLELGNEVNDCGAHSLQEFDDYVDFAKAVGEKVASEQGSRGIVICGSGAGVDIAANKINGIRSALGFNIEQVKAARSDDNVNILSLAADFTFFDDSKSLIEAFLNTPYNPTDNHVRRVTKIKNLEA